MGNDMQFYAMLWHYYGAGVVVVLAIPFILMLVTDVFSWK